VIDEIFETYDRLGQRSYGEDVTQLAHMLQAAHFAATDHAPDELVAAALLHDVGHFIEEAGDAAELSGIDARHEVHGAAYLARIFPTAVTAPIALHVAAKRYLCAVEPGYLDGLSDASRLSLSLQGCAFTPDEVRAFEARPYFSEAVRLRRYDDLAKQPELDVAGLETYRPLLQRLARRA
jgi:phosphonate degradation associated HDIG domain protein